MTFRTGLWTMLGLLLGAGTVLGQMQGQAQPWRGSPPDARRPALPDQPVMPQHPTLERRPAARPQVPFQLTPQQEAYLDRVLQAWEARSAGVKTFACRFTRWEYDPVFGPANTHRYKDAGEIRYGTPDRGLFRALDTEKNGKMVPIGDDRAEHWMCDGRSIYEYNFPKRQLVQHKLPPSLQGKAIADGPLPFLFGAEAAKLKRRYFMRVITPPDLQNQQIWLQAYPRFQQDAANFSRAELILAVKDMLPYALQVFAPNEKNHTTYQFDDIVINDPLGFLKGNPFHARTPLGWKMLVEEAPAERVSLEPTASGTR